MTTSYDAVRYNRRTWDELDEELNRNRPVALLPLGSTEQHGRHLPLDVDSFIAESVCLEAATRIPGKALVLPPIPYGLNLHHIDFPGTIHVAPEAFIAYCLHVTKSLAYHGFDRILLVNGHGSNMTLIELIARRTILETEALCAAVNYFMLPGEEFQKVRDTDIHSHADEFETSIYLYLAADRVRMDKAVANNHYGGRYLGPQSHYHHPVKLVDYWSSWTDSGVHGDPTTATAEKGRVLFEASVTHLAAAIEEFRDMERTDRRDFHANGPKAVVW